MGERRASDGSVVDPGCLFVENRAIRAKEEEEEEEAGSGERSPARGSNDGPPGADRRIGDTAWGYYPTCE